SVWISTRPVSSPSRRLTGSELETLTTLHTVQAFITQELQVFEALMRLAIGLRLASKSDYPSARLLLFLELLDRLRIGGADFAQEQAALALVEQEDAAGRLGP